VSTKPTAETEGYTEFGGGEFGRYWLEGAVGGPISDRVRGRLAGRWEQADGYWENRKPGGDDSFETDVRGIRTHVEFDVTEDLLARLSVSYDERPKSGAGTYNGVNFYVDETGMPAPQPADLDAFGAGPGAHAFGYRYEYGKGPKGAFDDVGFLENDNLLSTFMLQWSHADLTITSLSNYTNFSNQEWGLAI
jgi:iron complex outermembrane receptor protein